MLDKILIIIAHPDDEILGMGGTIKKLLLSGKKISVLLLSETGNARLDDNNKKRIENFKEVMKKLEISNLFFEDFPDTSFDTIKFLDIIKKIENTIDIVKPDIVYTHFYNDLNIDHSITSKAVITALRPIEKYKYVKKIFLFEIPSSTEIGIGEKFNPNYYEDITEFLNDKIDLLKIYNSEIRNFPNPRSIEGIQTYAKFRGMQSGLNSAEAFMLYRCIN